MFRNRRREVILGLPKVNTKFTVTGQQLSSEWKILFAIPVNSLAGRQIEGANQIPKELLPRFNGAAVCYGIHRDGYRTRVADALMFLDGYWCFIEKVMHE